MTIIIAYICLMFFKRFICLLITSIILLADSGQMIYAHTCLKSGDVTLSLKKPGTDCCPVKEVKHNCCNKKKKEIRPVVKSNHKSCCALSSKYVKQSFPTNTLEAKKQIELPTVLIALATIFKVYEFNSGNYPIAQTTSPPLIIPEGHISFTQVIRC